MKFTIITISYNEEKRIAQTMKSIYSQTDKDFEHIIEDGESTDATLSVVEKYRPYYNEGSLKVYSEKDNGLYDAMNRALERATGQYICFINSGDLLFDENTLAKVKAEIEMNPGMDWYYGMSIIVFPNQDEFVQVPCTIENQDGKNITELLKREPLRLNHQSIFAHRNCFVDNKFDTHYKLRSELKWYYKCLVKRCKVKKMDFPVCRYALGGCSEHVASVDIHAKETREIFSELELLTVENRELMPVMGNASERSKNIYNQWLALRQAGYTVSEYLKKKHIHKIAIYGYAEFGTHLINELKGSDIEIVCMIDQQKRYPFSKIPVVKPDDDIKEVDAVIVTALLHFKEIKENMSKKVSCKIMSLEDILEDMWE